MPTPRFPSTLVGVLFALLPAVVHHSIGAGEPSRLIESDLAAQTVTIADGRRDLVLRLRYDGRCVLDQVQVGSRNVIAPDLGVASTLMVNGHGTSTRAGITRPRLAVTTDSVTITDLGGSAGGIAWAETWRFQPQADRIVWRIEREYQGHGLVEDAGLPEWSFADRTTWTGALLGHGGVAWARLFDTTNATYGVHGGDATFWNRQERLCLRIGARPSPGKQIATRFTRRADGGLAMAHSVTEERQLTRHGLRRYLRDRPDVWAPWPVRPGVVAVEYTLEALPYERAYDRGSFPYFSGASIREILHTIARIGAIDDELMGSNGYYSGYAVLHEPWIAQLGLAINDPGYTRAFARTLDFQRAHALGADGRVKSRWSYDAGDAMPGTYDAHGFYECQWGWLLDSQPSYVINVADQFDFTGDLAWLRGHKAGCEAALDFLLRRDQDGDGLVEMMTETNGAARGSDWIDVIWAAHENAFVNAQLFHALNRWADTEEILGDATRAGDYRQRAARLKQQFNAPLAAGGFWNPAKQWYVHWRDKDDSVHGDNLVVPVNFMAIAYDLCDSPDRVRAILDQVEARMRREGLFFWPLCFESYQTGEGAAWQFPFPVYENGDLFLAWGETGTRAYARHNPAVAVKYIKNVLDQYERDGLAFQRYLRKSQKGEGNDILANNCSPVVGLYRNIYGVQPKWNRLLLDPHLTPELNGTRLRYTLRDKVHEIDLRENDYRVTAHGYAIRAHGPFAANLTPDRAEFFPGSSPTPTLTLGRSETVPLEIRIERWADTPQIARVWTLTAGSTGPKTTVRQTVSGLPPSTELRLTRGPTGAVERVRSTPDGRLPELVEDLNRGEALRFELR